MRDWGSPHTSKVTEKKNNRNNSRVVGCQASDESTEAFYGRVAFYGVPLILMQPDRYVR